MTHLVTSESYATDGFEIEEIMVELDSDRYDLNRVVQTVEDDEVMVVVQRMAGHADVTFDLPLETINEGPAGYLFRGAMAAPFRAIVGLSSAGWSKTKVIVSRVRKSMIKAFRGFPCKLCKLAVKTIMSTLLIQLGVPMTPSGDYDLKGFVSNLSNLGQDCANGIYGQVVEALSGLLPKNWWNVILNLLHAANWLLDATDKFFERVCQLLGMCPSNSTSAVP